MAKNSMLHGALLLTGGNLFLRLCSMVFQVYTSRTVGAEGMGLLQLVYTVGSFAMTLGCSGVRIAAMYLPAEEYGLRRLDGVGQAVRCCLCYGLCISVPVGLGLYAFAEPLALRWLGSTAAAPSLRILGLFLPCTCLCSVMSGFFTACGRIRQFVTVEIVERLLSMAATFVLLEGWAKGNLALSCCAIIGGSSLGSLFDFVTLYLLYHRDEALRPSGRNLHMPSRLIRLCVPLALNDYLRCGLNTVEQFLIPYGLARSGQSYASSMASYGTLHGMVFPTLMFPAVLLFSLSDLLVPALSRARAEKNQARIASLTRRCLSMGLLFAAAVSGFFIACGEPLGRLLFKSPLAGAELRLYAPLLLILYLDAIVDGILKGLSQQLSCVRYNTLTSFLDVAGLFWLLPRFGMAGYFVSFAVTHLLNFVLSLRRLCMVTGYRIQPSSLCKSLGSMAACTLVCVLAIPEGLPAPALLALRGGCFAGIGLLLWGGELPKLAKKG